MAGQARILVAPGDDGVDDVVGLGEAVGGVGVAEPVECGEGAGAVIGKVQAVELLQRSPAGGEAWVVFEELVEAGAVGVAEGVGSA
jgi:hypothetical protein